MPAYAQINDWYCNQTICKGEYKSIAHVRFTDNFQLSGESFALKANKEQIARKGSASDPDFYITADLLRNFGQKVKAEDNVNLYSSNYGVSSSYILYDRERYIYAYDGFFRDYPSGGNGSFTNFYAKAKHDYKYITDARFGYCNHTSRAWYIKSKEVTIEQGIVHLKAPVLYFYGVPVIASPYYRYVTNKTRTSGFLVPESEFTSHSIYYSLPYYINIKPEADAIWSIVKYSDSSHGFEQKYRLLTSNSTSGLHLVLMEGGYRAFKLNNNFNYKNLDAQLNLSEFSHDDLLHKQGWASKIYPNTETNISRNFKVNVNHKHSSTSLYLENTRNMGNHNNVHNVDKLPELTNQINFELNDNLSLSNKTQLSAFNKQSKLAGTRLVTDSNINFYHFSKFLNLDGNYKFIYRQYSDKDHTNNHIIDLKTKSSFELSETLDLELLSFFRASNYKAQELLPIYDSDYNNLFDIDYFIKDKYTGYDRISNQNFASYANRMVLDLGKNYELVLSSNHKYNFNNEKVILQNSPNQAKGLLPTVYKLSLHSDQGDEINMHYYKKEQMDHFGINAAMNIDNNTININLSKIGEEYKVTSFAAIALSKQFRVLSYLQFNKSIEESAYGAEYNHCCWSTRILAMTPESRSANKESKISIQFILKGLTNKKAYDNINLLGSKISRYKWEPHAYY